MPTQCPMRVRHYMIILIRSHAFSSYPRVMVSCVLLMGFLRSLVIGQSLWFECFVSSRVGRVCNEFVCRADKFVLNLCIHGNVSANLY